MTSAIYAHSTHYPTHEITHFIIMRYGALTASGAPERQHLIVVMLFLFILFWDKSLVPCIYQLERTVHD